MSSLLQKLRDNRSAIILAEIGAYLHDLGKARKEFIEAFAKRGPGTDGHNFRRCFPEDLQNILTKLEVNICDKKANLLDFIEKHHDKQEKRNPLKDCEIPHLIRLLYAGWQGYDGMDSGLDKGYVDNKNKQRESYTFIATAFGYESEENKIKEATSVSEKLYNLVNDALGVYKTDNDILKLREAIMKKTEKYYLKFLGETRRPTNDVTLWDHSYSVATLFKCAIAKNIVDCSKASFDPLDFNWKILSVNIDVLGILAKGIKVGDILGYKGRIDDALCTIKKLIEEKYPIGNEIYRDTSGIYFLIPDIEIEELRKELLNVLKEIESELMPTINIKEIPPILSDSDYHFKCLTQQEEITKTIKNVRINIIEKEKKELLKKALSEARSDALQEISYPTSTDRFFSDKFGGDWINKEVCPICRLRPMEENSDGCEHCLDRRESRAEKWIENPKQTIWLDEVSDHNDRVALLVGRFVLDKWLDGSFIETMAIKTNPVKFKNPSPARIRRVWETTQKFIEDCVLERILPHFPYGKDTSASDLRKKRVQFKMRIDSKIRKGATLDRALKGVKLNPVCIDEDNGVFVITTNLQLLKEWGNTAEEIAFFINEGMKTDKGEIISECNLADGIYQDYLPYVKLYSYPDQFMAVVPAYDALDLATQIIKEYEIQFSKVRDRLPFHIGIIGFHRKTPLYIVMDAGKRLIETFKKETKINARIDSDPQDVEDTKLGNRVRELKLQVDPCYSSVPLEWRISYSTGDPDQIDKWHPYFRLNQINTKHVKELCKDDSVSIEGSYFKMMYLENASERFKVDENLRPLDDIRRLNNLWEEIEENLRTRKWSISQIYTFWQEVKNRYEAYKGDAVWGNFLRSSLINILEINPESVEGKKFFQATKDGLLDLCLHWHLQVRKIKPPRGGD